MDLFNKNIKSIGLFLILLFNTFIYTQTKLEKISTVHSGIELSIQFTSPNFNIKEDNNHRIADFYEFANPSLPGYPTLPSKIVYIAIPPNSKISIELIEKGIEQLLDIEPSANPELIKTSDSTYKEIKRELSINAFISEKYPSNDIELLGYTWIRDFYCAVIKINTHFYYWKDRTISIINSIKIKINYTLLDKISSVRRTESEYDKDLAEVILNYHYALDYRSIPHYKDEMSTSDWINYNNEYIKYGIVKDAIYRITKQDLENLGVNTSVINPNTFKLFFKGSEQNIYVKGENDNSFDDGDFIEFYAEKNYGSKDYKNIVKPGEEYLNYMNRYSDTSYVWLTWNGRNGLRTEEINNFNSSLPDVVNTHLNILHLENDERIWFYDGTLPRSNLPYYQEHKVWTWFFLGNTGQRAIQFNVENYVPNEKVNTIVRFISNGSNIQKDAHTNGVSLNSTTVQNTITYDYKSTVNLNTEYSTNNLLNGANTFRVFGLTNQATFHQALIDWIDIEYPSFNYAKNDSLLIRIRNEEQQGNKIIEVTNIHSSGENIIIYKTKPQLKRISGYVLSNSTLKFSDYVTAGDEYLVINSSSVKKPVTAMYKKFKNLRNKSRGADYIIITNYLLASSTSNYESFIRDEYNLRTQLIFVDDIYDEFNFGIKSTESIKDFLKYVYSNWTAPAPSFLTIIGDANYDHKDVFASVPSIRKKDLVPSFGMPVSDVWFTTWDSSDFSLQQMYVGRIPAENNEQVFRYLNKHKTYINKRFDKWNKLFFFFSGGDPTKTSELNEIKNANQYIFDNYVKNIPIGGIGNHFYKTQNPVSNFGPISQEYFNSVISEGANFISYIGHSGTQTWDNGITTVQDLKNNYKDRLPLITDFGCSTGRFAEPDVNAFGESFICGSDDGQAIAYFGNSSLGYLSSSLTFPKLFYEKLLINNIAVLGKTHQLAKIKLLTEYSNSDVNRVFNYCNLLFGDPIINFAVPSKPNFSINDNSITLMNTVPNDLDEFLQLKVTINNFGIVPNDSLIVNVSNIYEDNTIFEKTVKIPSPLLNTDIFLDIPILGKTGIYNVTVELNKDKSIDELYFNDNKAVAVFNVYSTNLRTMESDPFYNSKRKEIILLNPISLQTNTNEELILSVSDNENFINAAETTMGYDSLFTKLSLGSLQENKRYWWRTRVNNPVINWSYTNSFVNKGDYTWFIDSTHKPEDIILEGIEYNLESKSWQIEEKHKLLKITSAGSNDGKYASLTLDGEEKLPNTFFWGIVTAEIDTVTLTLSNVQYFVYPLETSAPALTNYINSLPQGTTIAISICDDGAQSVLGFTPPSSVREAIKNLGSILIDNVRYRESWCMIGRKGALPGTVPESYKKHFEGPASVEILKSVKKEKGHFILPLITKSTGWESIHLTSTRPQNSIIKVTPLAQKVDGKIDTLSQKSYDNGPIEIGYLDHNIFPSLKLRFDLEANSSLQSPQISDVGVNYKTLPELGLNYQVVSISSDSIMQGGVIHLYYTIVNAGYSSADSFSVVLELIKPDNSIKFLTDTIITSISPLSKKHFIYSYLSNYEDGFGKMSFKITIDKENRIKEFYKDNNVYQQPFYVIRDETTSVSTANVKVFFDGTEIYDDDYISSTPSITAELEYDGNFAVNDTSSVQFFLDGKQIYYSQFNNIKRDAVPRKIIYEFQPVLEDGYHVFTIQGKDVIGNQISNSGYQVRFIVNNNLQLLDVYNYPNPFRDITHFTFLLTRVPDLLTIKIYTIAGRLIKEIELNQSELQTNLNRIPWDGRDADGNPVANGVYIYKINARINNKNTSVIQKLAIIR